jgi:hypothetical protein
MMVKSSCDAADTEALREGRFQHPDPRQQGRMEALDLRRQTVATGEILRLASIAKARFDRGPQA